MCRLFNDSFVEDRRESMAAGVRFELTDPLGPAVFKTAPFDRSGTPPRGVTVLRDAATTG
jgi:hypothetical protein